jgi:SnoaL-like domain
MPGRLLVKTAMMIGAGVLLLSAPGAHARDADEIRSLFEREVRAENAHDIGEFAAVLVPSGAELSASTIMVTRAGKFVGRDTVVEHFAGYFKGSWKLDPDWAQLSIVPLGTDTYQLVVPSRITLGPPGKEPQTLPFLINEVAVRTSDGWRFTTIVAVLTQ